MKESAFSGALERLAKNISEANEGLRSTHAGYNHYSKVKQQCESQAAQSERLYLETLRTIERLAGADPSHEPTEE